MFVHESGHLMSFRSRFWHLIHVWVVWMKNDMAMLQISCTGIAIVSKRVLCCWTFHDIFFFFQNATLSQLNMTPRRYQILNRLFIPQSTHVILSSKLLINPKIKRGVYNSFSKFHLILPFCYLGIIIASSLICPNLQRIQRI